MSPLAPSQSKGFQIQREKWLSGLPLFHLCCLSALCRAGVFRSSSARRPQVPANSKSFTTLGLGNCRSVVCSSIFSSLFCGLRHLLMMSIHRNIYTSSHHTTASTSYWGRLILRRGVRHPYMNDDRYFLRTAFISKSVAVGRSRSRYARIADSSIFIFHAQR